MVWIPVKRKPKPHIYVCRMEYHSSPTHPGFGWCSTRVVVGPGSRASSDSSCVPAVPKSRSIPQSLLRTPRLGNPRQFPCVGTPAGLRSGRNTTKMNLLCLQLQNELKCKCLLTWMSFRHIECQFGLSRGQVKKSVSVSDSGPLSGGFIPSPFGTPKSQ